MFASSYRMKNYLLLLLVILAGCVTGSHVVTGKIHPAILPAGVIVYTEIPANAEMIGLVIGNAEGRDQQWTDKAIAQVKVQAAQIGANGICMDELKYGMSGVVVSAKAFFVR